MDPFFVKQPLEASTTACWMQDDAAKLYYFDQASSTMEVVNLLSNQPQVFGTFQQFLDDCKSGKLPDYSFIEPNYTDHGRWRR